MFEPCVDENVYEVIQFDDGLEACVAHPNFWSKVASWRGKVKLCNAVDGKVIESISEWKIRKVNSF